MKQTLSPHTYTCKCGVDTREYVWTSDLKTVTFTCPSCGSKLNSSNIKVKVEAAAIRTPTKNR
jgi:predicted SprT family Zn-dependent metalloprotease